MTKSIETTAPTIDDAIAKALRELSLERDDVSVEVLEKPKSGFLGFGAVHARIRVSYEVSEQGKVETYLKELLRLMGVEAEITIVPREDNTLYVDLKGENMGAVIGRRGDTLDAIQYLASLAVNRGEEEHVKLIIDTENYREKREESLKKLANKIAEKVVKSRRVMTLEPMNPYERRIIHATLQGNPAVETKSTGREPMRRVVVSLAGASPGERGTYKGGNRRPYPSGNRPRKSYDNRSERPKSLSSD